MIRTVTHLDVLQSHSVVQVLDNDLRVALVACCSSVAGVVVVVVASSCPSRLLVVIKLVMSPSVIRRVALLHYSNEGI